MQENQKGQALVEFVILLPIFIFMLFTCIDFGKILYTKNNLESKMDDVITVYDDNGNVEDVKKSLNLTKEKIDLEIKSENNYLTFSLQKKIDLITPGLNLLLGNPHEAIVKRVIYNE